MLVSKQVSAALALMGVLAGCLGGDEDKASIAIPDAIINGNAKVSCTVDCGDNVSCDQATIYVSACEGRDPGSCFEINPADGSGGNTYFIGLDGDGEASALSGVTCKDAMESKDGLPLDLVFVVDTTGSMGAAINGVVESIDAFVMELAENGVKARVGGMAFGDGAPLSGCAEPDAPFAALTDNFGPGSDADPDSFNYWLGNLSASHCGDGGGDSPENALDAVEYVLGRDGNEDDLFTADDFEWNSNSLRVIVVITDVTQHEESDGTGIAHFELEEVAKDVQGFAVVHVVGPEFGCRSAHPAACTCNTTPNECDEGCVCDRMCGDESCDADVTAGLCDDPDAGCDIDCAGYPGDVTCDTTVGWCDTEDDGVTPCADDFDCQFSSPLSGFGSRRCDASTLDADVGVLADVTGGAFTALPADGRVDLTELPLSGVITATEQCESKLPDDAERLRCVYIDDDGNEGEVTVDLQ